MTVIYRDCSSFILLLAALFTAHLPSVSFKILYCTTNVWQQCRKCQFSEGTASKMLPL